MAPINKKIQRALLWDVDGVLIDSEPFHIAKLKEVSSHYGIELLDEHMMTPQKFRVPDGKGGMRDTEMPLSGAGDKNIYWWAFTQLLQKYELPLEKKNFDAPERVKFISQHQWLHELMSFYLKNARNAQSPYKLKARDYMPEMLDHLRADGTIQAIVTNGVPDQVKINLDVLGEERKKSFAFILNANDIKTPKPSPEGYIKATERLQEVVLEKNTDANALAVVAIEDSETGVIAALSAGICCIHFLLPGQKPMTREEIKERLANEVGTTLSQTSFEQFLKIALLKYRSASSGKDVERKARLLFADTEKEAKLLLSLPTRTPHQYTSARRQHPYL